MSSLLCSIASFCCDALVDLGPDSSTTKPELCVVEGRNIPAMWYISPTHSLEYRWGGGGGGRGEYTMILVSIIGYFFILTPRLMKPAQFI